jgi:hypothetical protein
MPKDQFKREVEKELTGEATEPHEIIYFKIYKSQVPVIEQALETAALMLGTDRSRGYCLEMICADFLAGANLENGNPEVLLQSVVRFFGFLPDQDRHAFFEQVGVKACG